MRALSFNSKEECYSPQPSRGGVTAARAAGTMAVVLQRGSSWNWDRLMRAGRRWERFSLHLGVRTGGFQALR